MQPSSFSVFLGLLCRALCNSSKASCSGLLQALVPPCRLQPRALVVLWPTSTPLAPLLSPEPKGQACSPSLTFIYPLTISSFFPKSSVKQPLTTAGLIVSWPRSLFSEPTKSLGGIVHWQYWCLYFKLSSSTLTRFPWWSYGVWVAIPSRLYSILVWQSFLILFLQNATLHGIWPCASLDAVCFHTAGDLFASILELHHASTPWWPCWSEAVSSWKSGAQGFIILQSGFVRNVILWLLSLLYGERGPTV